MKAEHPWLRADIDWAVIRVACRRLAIAEARREGEDQKDAEDRILQECFGAVTVNLDKGTVEWGAR